MAACEDPPVLLDAAGGNWLLTTTFITTTEQKLKTLEQDEAEGEAFEDEAQNESMFDENDESNEEAHEEEEECGGEEEEEGSEDGDEYYYYGDDCYGDNNEEEEEEITPCPGDDFYIDDTPKVIPTLYSYQGSDASFQGSTTFERKKRRYLVGNHSFLDLADPQLETALDPYVEPEPEEEEEDEVAAKRQEPLSLEDEEAEAEIEKLTLASLRDDCIALREERLKELEEAQKPEARVISLRDRLKDMRDLFRIGHGFEAGHAKGPDHKTLIIKRADFSCTALKNTTLVALMEKLAKGKPELTVKEFKKFIKKGKYYKDKTSTAAFQNVFQTEGKEIDVPAIIEAFDKVYPGLRHIPDPNEEPEEEPEKKKKKKGKKEGKGKDAGNDKKGAGGGGPKKDSKKGKKK